MVKTNRCKSAARPISAPGRVKLSRHKLAALRRMTATTRPLGIARWRREDLYRDVLSKKSAESVRSRKRPIR